MSVGLAANQILCCQKKVEKLWMFDYKVARDRLIKIKFLIKPNLCEFYIKYYYF